MPGSAVCPAVIAMLVPPAASPPEFITTTAMMAATTPTNTTAPIVTPTIRPVSSSSEPEDVEAVGATVTATTVAEPTDTTVGWVTAARAESWDMAVDTPLAREDVVTPASRVVWDTVPASIKDWATSAVNVTDMERLAEAAVEAIVTPSRYVFDPFTHKPRGIAKPNS